MHHQIKPVPDHLSPPCSEEPIGRKPEVPTPLLKHTHTHTHSETTINHLTEYLHFNWTMLSIRLHLALLACSSSFINVTLLTSNCLHGGHTTVQPSVQCTGTKECVGVSPRVRETSESTHAPARLWPCSAFRSGDGPSS